MTNHDGTEELRVDFEAELSYRRPTGDGHSRHTEKEPGYLSASSGGAVQFFDTPRHKLFGKASFQKSARFDVAVSDVSSLRWNEATGTVHLNTRDRKGMRALRPLFYSDREIAVPASERLAQLWFPGAVRVRTEMSDREQKFNGMWDRVFSLVFMLLPIAFIAYVISMGAPLGIVLVFGAIALLFAFFGRKAMNASTDDRDEVKALIAEGKTWVEVTNPTFQAD